MVADGTVRPDDERHMDLGGLWTTEQLRAPPEGYIDDLQLRAIVTLALQEPGLPEAVEVLLGRRGVDEGMGHIASRFVHTVPCASSTRPFRLTCTHGTPGR